MKKFLALLALIPALAFGQVQLRSSNIYFTGGAVGGTWSAIGTWTPPAYTMGGAISNPSNYAANFGSGALTAGSAIIGEPIGLGLLQVKNPAATSTSMGANLIVNLSAKASGADVTLGFTDGVTYNAFISAKANHVYIQPVTAGTSVADFSSTGLSLGTNSLTAGASTLGATTTTGASSGFLISRRDTNAYVAQWYSAAGNLTLDFDGVGTLATFSSTGLAVTGALSATTSILSSGATSGIGYATGAGGSVTQGTNRTTGVTINKASGAITLVSAAGSTSWQTFTVTNSAVAATDVPYCVQKSGTDLYEIHTTAVGAGSFNVTYRTTGGTTTEQPVFNCVVIKAVAS